MKLFALYYKDGPAVPEAILLSRASAKEYFKLMAEEDGEDDVSAYEKAHFIIELDEIFPGVFNIPENPYYR